MGKHGKVLSVELNLDGITELKETEAVRSYVMSICNQRKPSGCGGIPWSNEKTTGVAIYAWTKAAAQDNLENNTLLKAFGS